MKILDRMMALAILVVLGTVAMGVVACYEWLVAEWRKRSKR